MIPKQCNIIVTLTEHHMVIMLQQYIMSNNEYQSLTVILASIGLCYIMQLASTIVAAL